MRFGYGSEERNNTILKLIGSSSEYCPLTSMCAGLPMLHIHRRATQLKKLA